MAMNVRAARPDDHTRLLELWERAVRATHGFLTDADIVSLRPLVAQELAGLAVNWWVLATNADAIAGFLGYTSGTIEALFVDPAHYRQGAGKLLVAHAQTLAGSGALAVDVNEQNEGAVAFYQALGFTVVGRSPSDAGGRPFPILHMRRGSPGSRSARR